MTPYETINQYILDDVGRPDMQSIIDRRIQRSLMNHHRMERFQKDLVEQIYVFTPPETMASLYTPEGSNSLFLTNANPVNKNYVQQIDKRLLTRWRLFIYLNKFNTIDPLGNGSGISGEITEKNPDSMFNAYGGQLEDVYYESGDYINIRASHALNQVFMGYISDPLIEPVASIYSWVAKDWPSVIAADVKRRIFGDIGKQDEQKSAEIEYKEQLLLFLGNNVKISSRK